MITMLDRDVLDLYNARSTELIAAADRHRQAAAHGRARGGQWRLRLPRLFTLDITLRITMTAPPGSATRRAT